MAVLSSPSGKQLTLWFPGRLPAPVVHGATATYRSVRPGVDLQIAAGAYGSVAERLIVHTRAALASSWLRQLTLSYRAAGLRLAIAKSGDVLASDQTATIFTMSAPVTSAPVPRPAGRAVVAGPSQVDKTARARVAGQSIVLPARIGQLPTRIDYPVSISATLSADAAASSAPAANLKAGAESPNCVGAGTTCTPFNDPMDGYVEVQDICNSSYCTGGGSCDGVKNWDSGSVTELGIGYNAWTSCIGTYQTYYLFGMGLIDSGAYIFESSVLQIPVVYSALGSCTSYSEPVNLSSLGRGAAGTFGGPNADGADMSLLPGGYSTETQDTPPASSIGSSCPARSVSFNVLSYMKTGQSEGAAFWNYGVSGNDATDGYGFMRLSDNPSLVTTFDETPPAPTADQSTPPMMVNASTQSTNYGCTAADGIPWIGATTTGSISLAATFSSSLTGGEEVMPSYSASWSGGSASYSTPAQSQVASGLVDPYPLITSPVNGDEYSWSAQTSVNLNNTGNTYTSAPMSSCIFAYDATAPTKPAISSTTFPELNNSSGAVTTQTAPGGSGTFAFKANDQVPAGCSSANPIANASDTTCLASGLYQFDYSLNQPLSGTPMPLMSGGTANCPSGSSSGAVPATNPSGNPQTSSAANPSASITASSCSVPISQWGTNTLYVEAVDLAGNISQTSTYQFYVPASSTATQAPGDLTGDGIPDLLATVASSPSTNTDAGDLLLYSGADPAAGPQVASMAADSPASVTETSENGDPTTVGWDQLDIAHRGSWSGGIVDDLIVLDPPDGLLFRYQDKSAPLGTFENSSYLSQIYYPTCGACSSDYPGAASGWGQFSQILVPGDAWAGASGDTDQQSLLAVTSAGSLFLFQGAGGGQLENNPVELGSTGWNNVTLLAPGDVAGQLTLWARINTGTGTDAGDIISFPLNPSKTLGSPTSGTGTILDGSSGSPLQLSPSTYPLVTSPGPAGLSGDTCSAANTAACPALYAVNSSGELVLFAGQPTTSQADPLTGGTPVNIADVGTDLTQLS